MAGAKQAERPRHCERLRDDARRARTANGRTERQIEAQAGSHDDCRRSPATQPGRAERGERAKRRPEHDADAPGDAGARVAHERARGGDEPRQKRADDRDPRERAQQKGSGSTL